MKIESDVDDRLVIVPQFIKFHTKYKPKDDCLIWSIKVFEINSDETLGKKTEFIISKEGYIVPLGFGNVNDNYLLVCERVVSGMLVKETCYKYTQKN